MNNISYPPLFIALEGIDGCGKSTQAELLAQKLSDWGKIKTIKEPGGSEESLALRDYILSKDRPDFGAIGNALLFEVSRAKTVESVIDPALNNSTWIICDRYVHSGFAYTGVYENIPKLFRIAEEICPVWPDITFFIDIPVEESCRRRRGKIEDRIEARGSAYLDQVRENYKSFTKCDPLKFTRYPTESMLLGIDTFIEIDGLRTIEEITSEMYKKVIDLQEALNHSDRFSRAKMRRVI
jgi:dTMP kinase